MFLRRTQAGRGRRLALIEQVEGIHSRAINLFRVGKNALLYLQPLIFPGLKLSCFNFAFLEIPKIEQAQAVLLITFQFFDSRLNALPPRECLGGCLQLDRGV